MRSKALKRDLGDFDILTVSEEGFYGITNGKLLAATKDKFDVLITVDKNIRHQQNAETFGMAILILSAHSDRYESLSPLIPRAVAAVGKLAIGEIVIIKK